MPLQLRVKVLSDQPKRHSSILFTALINESSKESQALSKLIPISEDHNKSVLIMNISALPEDRPWFSSEDWPPWGSSPVLRTSLSSRRQPLGHGLSTLLTTISGLKERNTSSCPSSLDSTGNYSIWRWPTSRPTGPRTPRPESEISWELHENKSSTSQSILTILTSETTLFLTTWSTNKLLWRTIFTHELSQSSGKLRLWRISIKTRSSQESCRRHFKVLIRPISKTRHKLMLLSSSLLLRVSPTEKWTMLKTLSSLTLCKQSIRLLKSSIKFQRKINKS